MNKTFERLSYTSQYKDGVEESTQTHVTTFVRKTKGEPSFVKMYLEDIGRYKNMQGRTIQVLHQFLRIMDYKNEVNVSIGVKQEICQTLGIYNETPDKGKVLGMNAIDQHIYKMINAGVIARKRKGLFVVNPELFGKGAWADIKAICLHLTHNDDGTIMYSEISKEEKE